MRWRFLFDEIILGLIITLAVGFIENRLGVGIPEFRYYGYPLVWRIVYFDSSFFSSMVVLNNLIVDMVIWTMVSLVVVFLMQKVFHK